MNPSANRVISLQEISTTQAASLDLPNRLAILPIGSNEQHGPHLPTGTDSLIMEHVVAGVREALGRDFPAFFMPLIPYGKSPEHLDFIGTINLRATTLIAVLQDVVSSLALHGIKKLVFLNSHGGNSDLLSSIAFDLRQEYQVEVYTLNLWGNDFFGPGVVESFFPGLQYPDVHAASIETSMLLYLTPERVAEVPVAETHCEPFPDVTSGWATRDLSNNGVIGDLSGASADAGEKVYRYTVETVAGWLKRIAAR